MKRKPIEGAKPGPFYAYDFAAIGETSGTVYRRDGRHDDFVMQVATSEGADEMAAILNAAAALASHADLLGGTDAYRRSKIAHAVAKALDGQIDFISFDPASFAAAA